ncbi:unnamed protein product [Camellia sinensis]
MPHSSPNSLRTHSPPHHRTDPPQPSSDSGLRFREKLLYLQTLKVNPSKALHKNPNFRSAPLDSLKSVEKCLSSMGIDRSASGRIFDMYSQLLTCDPYSDLYPVFDFLLNHVNIPFPDIRKSIIRCPTLNLQCRSPIETRITFPRKFGVCGETRINLPEHTVVGFERRKHAYARKIWVFRMRRC